MRARPVSGASTQAAVAAEDYTTAELLKGAIADAEADSFTALLQNSESLTARTLRELIVVLDQGAWRAVAPCDIIDVYDHIREAVGAGLPEVDRPMAAMRMRTEDAYGCSICNVPLTGDGGQPARVEEDICLR
eukprot:gene37892-16267_t